MTPPTAPRVAYLMSRFPKLSETFVVTEILGVESEGIEVEIFPLIHEREQLQQPAAAPLVERARFQPVMSLRILASAIAWLVESPRQLLATVVEAFRGVWGSRSFVFGLVGLLPKTLHNARVMRELGVSHVHAHFAHHPALAALVIHRLTGIPFSFTGHGHDIQVDRRMLCHKIEVADFAVAVSEFNRGLMVDGCPALADRVTVVHTGVDPEALAPAPATSWAEEQWPSGPRALRVLAVGRLQPVKGHHVLLDAVARLRSWDVPVQAMIVGDGPRRSALEERSAELALGEQLRLAGPLPHHQVIDLMRSADVVALPSVRTEDGRVEGIPVVLMEAMSLGVPVVASDLPGVRELVTTDDEGVRFPMDDADALAEALRQLTDDDERHRVGENGRHRIIEAFDARSSARELAQRFRASAAQRPGPGRA